MKLKTILVLLMSTLLFSCEKKIEFTIQNTLDEDRTDEVVIFSRADIAKKLDLKDAVWPVFAGKDQEIMASQVDDLNGDGVWDEVIVVLDLAAGETVSLEVELVPESEYPVWEKRTNVRLGIKQEDGSYKEFDNYRALPCTDEFKVIAQAESVSWENDKIAFRNYFDCRNVKDLFGKLLPGMILDKIATPEMGSYHKLADWGMDVLHCGSSLGSGGIALLKEDSLFRVGSTDFYEYQKIIEGPFRSVFELRYAGWDVDGEMMECVEHVTIYPGKYWFESDVTMKGCPDGSQIVTGIVTSHLKRDPFEFKEADFQCIGTHDVQSLNKDELGMAVLVPEQEAGKIGRTTDINFYKLGYRTVDQKGFSNIISETYYIGQKCKSDESAKHYFFSVWGLDDEQWKTEDGFKKYIREEARKLSNPVKVY